MAPGLVGQTIEQAGHRDQQHDSQLLPPGADRQVVDNR
jgi:hypothetical protein